MPPATAARPIFFAVLLGALGLWGGFRDLKTGTAMFGRARNIVYRDDNPVLFWALALLKFAIGLGMLAAAQYLALAAGS